MIDKEDLKGQLQRLYNIARHNFHETDSDVDRTFEKGQMFAFRAVAISYGIEVL